MILFSLSILRAPQVRRKLLEMMVLLTSALGLPKPVICTHGHMSLIDRWKTLPSVDGARPYVQLLAEGSKFHCSIPIFHVSYHL
jgi:hypothetical protein